MKYLRCDHRDKRTMLSAAAQQRSDYKGVD